MSHEALKHLMVPTPPRSSFVVVHSGFTLALLERSFHGPPQATNADKFLGRATRWSIAQIEFLFSLRSNAATTDEPLTNARQTIVNWSHAQYCKLRDQRALAAFMDQMSMPGGFWQIPGQNPHLFRCRRATSNAPTQAGRTLATWTRFFHERCAQPDPRVTRYLGHVPFTQNGHSIRKSRIFPVTFVVGDPSEGNDRALIQFPQHIQRQLTLRLKMNALRQAASFPQFAMIRGEPFLRQVQTLIHEGIAATTGVGQKHALLAVRDFSQVTAILMRHPNRMFPLLGKATAIYNCHAVMLSQPGSHQSLQVHHERSRIPFTFTHEPLQVTDCIRNRTQQQEHHGLDRLAFQVG